MDNYKAAQLQDEARRALDEYEDINDREVWWTRPFQFMWLGLKWVFALFLFISITHDVIMYIINNWGK